MPMHRLVTVVFTVALVVTPLLVRAAEDTNPNRETYLKLCSSCHGADGKGDGALASMLTPKPTDLTQLAKKNGGEFNAVVIYEAIAGPRLNAAHGTAQMPIWGEVLRREPGGAEPRASEVTLAKIVNYLRSIQQK
jgi:hypothetical protein